ncbi:HdeD family acid-resistance protein [Bradyrhizobium pachyrhizi]|uniref:HdeD family acid-resistance protein n=1 Tax=Bradyrhizobium pachyrhizi TaxID=280333 RepID=A0A844SLU9_9BRAD|nr:HdeD family acid-resistance protein [Bradyrhizobium pachyrhizi]MVT64904.1 HdeD family acid-resistance protein [Bradyrhizobium pachyrhizi]
MTNAYQTSALPGAFADLRARWGWFVVLGIVFIVLGAIAISNLLVATIATVYYVGALMTIAGVMQIIQSFRVKTWGGFLLWLLSGVLYAAAGLMTFINPLLASFVFTLMLALLTLSSGMLRLWLGFQARAEHGWGWIIASGVVTTVAGLIFLLGWPINSLWLLGLLLSLDLAFQGCALVGLGLRLRTAG